jgi:hypothetical protein
MVENLFPPQLSIPISPTPKRCASPQEESVTKNKGTASCKMPIDYAFSNTATAMYTKHTTHRFIPTNSQRFTDLRKGGPNSTRSTKCRPTTRVRPLWLHSLWASTNHVGISEVSPIFQITHNTHTIATKYPHITYTPPIHTETSQRLPSIDEN